MRHLPIVFVLILLLFGAAFFIWGPRGYGLGVFVSSIVVANLLMLGALAPNRPL